MKWFKDLEPSVQRAAFWSVAISLSVSVVSLSTCSAIKNKDYYAYKIKYYNK